MYCPNCGVQVPPSARFCTECGTALSAGASSSSSSSTTKNEWLDDYFRGNLSSAGEQWTYRNGVVTCVSGFKASNVEFQWNGHELICSSSSEGGGGAYGKGVWNGGSGTAEWYFPEDPSTPFWRMTWQKERQRFHNDSIRWRSPVHWTWSENKDNGSGVMSIEEGSGQDSKEGLDSRFEKQGDFPLPVVLFAAMFRRTVGLREERIERLSRGYTRCNKFVGGIGTAPRPVLCSSCASPGCMVCAAAFGGTKHPGKLCKMCGIKKLFCAKCGDKTTEENRTEGFLCNGCGLGSSGNNCCRMTYNIQTL
ncbi:C-type lectin domain-containing protein [Balamuthia mandrillaris]